MTPSVLNKVCAHPVVVSWVLGACLLNAMVTALLFKEVSLTGTASDWHDALLLSLVFIPATLLGYFVGMFACWPLVRVICSRFNGAPLKTGDRVLILSGPQKGYAAVVYEITSGQGGWNLARLDFGLDHAKTFNDIFEEYSVLKIEGEPDGSENGSQPSRLTTNSTTPKAGSRH